MACAFGAHFIKEVTRAQLSGAVKSLLSKDERKVLSGAEKSRLLKPLARAFVSKGIVSKRGSHKYCELNRNGVIKTGTY